MNIVEHLMLHIKCHTKLRPELQELGLPLHNEFYLLQFVLRMGVGTLCQCKVRLPCHRLRENVCSPPSILHLVKFFLCGLLLAVMSDFKLPRVSLTHFLREVALSCSEDHHRILPVFACAATGRLHHAILCGKVGRIDWFNAFVL